MSASHRCALAHHPYRTIEAAGLMMFDRATFTIGLDTSSLGAIPGAKFNLLR
jgi:hypothetical protein